MENTLSVILVEPGKAASKATIQVGLKSLQSIVGGSIEATYPFDDPVAIVCNDEGKLLRLPPCRALYDENGNLYDIVAGTFLIVGLGAEDFTSLSPELTQKYLDRFRMAEFFFPMGADGVAVYRI